MDTTLAYLAGLIDGEGYVGIKKTSPKNCAGPRYMERVQVRMVHEPAIRLLAETLGGNYYREKAHANNGKPLYCYQASDAKACVVLQRLLPYLLVKRESAMNVLALRARKQERRWWRTMPDDERAAREALYLRAKELNRVGV